jgi:hypothetical protein
MTVIALIVLAALLGAAPTFALLARRDTIPPGVLWAAVVVNWTVPVIGWCFAVWAATHDFTDKTPVRRRWSERT